MRNDKSNGVLIAAAVILILDTILVLWLRAGFNVGTLLPAAAGCAILAYTSIRSTGFYRNNSRLFKKVEKLAEVLIIVWGISFILISLIIVKSAISQKDQSADCVLILGAGLKGDTPSLVLKERLDLALEYIHKNPEAEVIVSGGKGIGESISEAEGMKRYLVARGVEGSKILKEEKSTSTIENFMFSKAIYKKDTGMMLKRVMIITSDFHMFRAKFLAARAGLEAGGISSGTPFYIYPNVFVREYFAIFKSYFMDRP